MARRSIGARIDDLIQREKWPQARALIQSALRREPDSHWLLTQLAETHYEERQYAKALELLLKSKSIVPECPLTKWHLAGVLDALGRHDEALILFADLLSSKVTADDDPCWESADWADALKTDCVYSIGLCHRNGGDPAKAVQCFREYIRLLANGMPGSYAVDDVIRQLSALQPSSTQSRRVELRKAAQSIRRNAAKLSPA
jgi:tetratricopeptide (TPR) repeat protein